MNPEWERQAGRHSNTLLDIIVSHRLGWKQETRTTIVYPPSRIYYLHVNTFQIEAFEARKIRGLLYDNICIKIYK